VVERKPGDYSPSGKKIQKREKKKIGKRGGGGGKCAERPYNEERVDPNYKNDLQKKQKMKKQGKGFGGRGKKILMVKRDEPGNNSLRQG